MKNKNQPLIIGTVFAAATIIVLILAALNREFAYAIFVTFAVTVMLLGAAVSIYWYLFKADSIKQSLMQMRDFIESIDAIAIVWQNDFSYLYPNSTMKNRLGYDENDLSDAIVLRKVFPRDALSPEGIERMIGVRSNEFMAEGKDGSDYYLIWNTSVISEDKKSGRKVLVSIGFDLTEIKLMQKKLEDSEKRYALSMELSEIGIILSDEGNSYFYISKQLQDMLGYSESLISFTELRKRVHPKDLVLYDTYIKFIFSRNGIRSNRTHSLEIRLLSANNKYRWYLHRYKIVAREDNLTSRIGGAFIDITKDKEKDEKIEKMAYIDEITDIYNRNKLMNMGQEIYEGCLALDYSYWVIVLDIDKFHIVNDACGYSNGNLLLKRFGQIIINYLSEGGIGARIGGDNFALIIKDSGDINLPKITIEKIQKDFAALSTEVFSSQTLSFSAGYSKMPSDGRSFAEVLDRAEFALSSGEKKRGTIISYNEATHETIIFGSQLEKALADAINDDELHMYYQPKINLQTGDVIGVEALIRWKKKDGSLVLPGNFVPVAESSKLISKISEYALFESCRQNVEWQRMGLPKIIMSINLTSVDFYQNDMKETINKILKETQMDPECLEVELTETLALKDVDMAIAQMNMLKEMGIKIAMDDFGTGYSSLSYIQVLPITLLKLDRSFIINLETDEIAREIVSSVIRIAKAKKIETIAEGIENENQVKILKESGCDHAQGFYFGKPMPAEQFVSFFSEKINNKYKVVI